MAKPEWGEKHRCSSCGKPFYDMKRVPIICPVCGEKHVPVKLLKSRKMSAAKPKTTKPIVDAVSEDDPDSADTTVPDDDISVQNDDEGDDISGVIVPKSTNDDL